MADRNQGSASRELRQLTGLQMQAEESVL